MCQSVIENQNSRVGVVAIVMEVLVMDWKPYVISRAISSAADDAV